MHMYMHTYIYPPRTYNISSFTSLFYKVVFNIYTNSIKALHKQHYTHVAHSLYTYTHHITRTSPISLFTPYRPPHTHQHTSQSTSINFNQSQLTSPLNQLKFTSKTTNTQSISMLLTSFICTPLHPHSLISFIFHSHYYTF